MSLRVSIPITLRALPRGFHIVPDEEIERDPSQAPRPIDYAPLLDAGRRVALWLLDVARNHASDPLDLTAIDRVQRAVLVACASKSTECALREVSVSEEDLLTVAGILITAFEIDFGVSGLGSLAGSLYDATDGDLSAIRIVLAEAMALGAAAGKRARSSKRGTVAVAPIVVRRRPRVVDEDALDDVLAGIASTR